MIEMNDNSITGRDGFIRAQSLLYAIAHIQGLAPERQEWSNMCDMCAIVRGTLPADIAATFAHSAYHHTGIVIDIAPDAEGDDEVAYKAAFNARFQDMKASFAKLTQAQPVAQ